jgi:autotransporter-associated beta strand protein
MSTFSASRAESVERSRARLGLESLEDRAVPALIATWDGGALLSNNWTADRNWVGHNAPNPGDDLQFAGGGDRKTTNDNDFASGTNFHSIEFTGGGYSLNGNRILLGSASNTNAGAVTNTLGNNTIALPLTLAGSTSTSITPRIEFEAASGTTLTVSGAIGGTSPFTTLAKTGTGTVVLTGTNTYAGSVLVEQGVLRLGSDDALGRAGGIGAVVANGATLELDSVTISDELISLVGTGNGSGALRASGLSALEASGSNTTALLGGDTTIRVDPASALTIENLANGSALSAELTKTGSGTLVLSGSTNSAIDYNLTQGRLEFIGNYANGSLVVGNGDRVTGTGTAPGATVNSGGHVDPGATINGNPNGRLTFNGNTLLRSGSFLDLEISGSTTFFDRIRVNGTVNVNGSVLNIVPGSTNPNPPLGTTFTIVENDGTDPVQGLFVHPTAGLSIPDDAAFNDVSGRQFRINYNGGDGNDVTVTFLGAPASFSGEPIALADTSQPGGQYVPAVNGTATSGADSPIGVFAGFLFGYDQHGLGNTDTPLGAGDTAPQPAPGGVMVPLALQFVPSASSADPGDTPIVAVAGQDSSETDALDELFADGVFVG